MERRLMATLAGVALVLVGGYFLLHDAVGFVLPQFTFNPPQINWSDVGALIAGVLGFLRWNLLWPAAALILGLLLLARASRMRVRTR
jgi:hypothetical protein